MREYSKNITMLMDFYELTMINGYFENNLDKEIAYFDYFFRTTPDKAGFAIFAGLSSVIDYIKNIKIDEKDIEFLKSKKIFGDKFLNYLKTFKFSGDIYSMQEGSVVFPNEPILSVRGNVFETQLIETVLLLFLNHQSLIATKANRIVRSAANKSVIEFGARRAHGVDASVLGARAAYIGGCVGTSNVLADMYFGVNSSGTMAHSWVQMFDSEYTAFELFAKTYPDNCILLIDTYNTLKSGIKNAIKVFDTILKPMNKRPIGVRIDSGDISYLSKNVRRILDNAGYEDCKIFVSNSLDEYIIRDLQLQGAKIDVYGVGERLISSKSHPVFGGVYKLVAVQKENKIIPKIKISENVEKITTPHYKQVYRIFDKNDNHMIADLITIYDEIIDETKELEIFHPEFTWKRRIIKDYYVKKMLLPIFIDGQLVYNEPNIEEIKNYCKMSVDSLWDECKRFENPHTYHVDLSQKLWDLKNKLIKENNFE